jgi:hypothetical protein
VTNLNEERLEEMADLLQTLIGRLNNRCGCHGSLDLSDELKRAERLYEGIRYGF